MLREVFPLEKPGNENSTGLYGQTSSVVDNKIVLHCIVMCCIVLYCVVTRILFSGGLFI